MKPSSSRLALLSLIGSMCIFGTIGIFRQYIPLPSGLLACVRGVIGVLFLLLLQLIRHQKPSLSAIRRNLPPLLLSGAFIGINWILLFESYRFVSVSKATVCYYLAPIFVVLASPFVLKERLTVRKALCAACALCGMVLSSGLIGSNETDAHLIPGLLCGIGAAAFYATVILLNKKIKDISAYDKTTVQLGAAALVVLPYVLLVEDISLGGTKPLGWILLAVVGIIHTGLAYVMYFGSMKHLKAGTVAIFSYIDPVIALILSVIILKDHMGILGTVGAIMVILAAFLCEQSEKPKKCRNDTERN